MKLFKTAVLGLGTGLVLSLAGCSGSSGHVYAHVGSTAIDAKMVSPRVKAVLATSSGAAAFQGRETELTNATVVRLIDHYVLAAVASERHVNVSRDEVKKKEAAIFPDQSAISVAAQSGVAPEDIDQVVQDSLLQEKLAVALAGSWSPDQATLQSTYDANVGLYVRAHIEDILVGDEATATRIQKEVQRDPSSFAQLAKDNSLDTATKDQGGDLGYVGKGEIGDPVNTAVFSAKVGDTLSLHDTDGWHVIRVVDLQTTTLAQAHDDVVQKAKAQHGKAALADLFVAEAPKLPVSVDPSLGTWNPRTGQITPPSASASPTPASTPGSGGSGAPTSASPSASPTR